MNKFKLIGFIIGIFPFSILLIILNIIDSSSSIFKSTLLLFMIITGILNSFILDYKIKKMD